MEKTKKLRGICNLILLILGLAAGCSCLIFAMGDAGNRSLLGFSMNIMYIMVALAIGLILLFTVLQIVSDQKKIISFGILAAVAVIVVLVSYFTAGSALSDVAIRLEVSKSVFKWSGALLNMAYIMLGAVIVAFITTLIYSKLKN